MNKKIIITGADFHINGYQYKAVTKVENTLYSYTGEIINSDEALSNMNSGKNGVYWYEKYGLSNIKHGSVITDIMSTVKGHTINDETCIVVPEGYTRATITTKCDTYAPMNDNLKGLIVIAFLDSNEKLLGGISTVDIVDPSIIEEKYITELVPKSNEVRTFTREIPDGCKYIVANTNDYKTFKIILSGTIVE